MVDTEIGGVRKVQGGTGDVNPTHPTALSPAPHGTPTLLDVRRLVTFGPDAADRFSGTNEGVSSSSTTRGTVMMVIGLLMILATVLIAVLTEDPLPAAFWSDWRRVHRRWCETTRTRGRPRNNSKFSHA